MFFALQLLLQLQYYNYNLNLSFLTTDDSGKWMHNFTLFLKSEASHIVSILPNYFWAQ